MNLKSPFAAIPYDGDMDKVDTFYKILGLNISDGRLMLDNFEFFFGAEELGINTFQLLVTVNEDLSHVEKKILNMGCEVVDSGMGSSGPYIVAIDPTGIRVEITLTMEKLAKSL